MYKHFVRTNQAGEVIAGFSNAFTDPEQGDVLVAETDERHFNLELFRDGVARYVVKSGKLVERTDAEIEAIAAPARERTAAVARLAELDAIVPRSVEDLYQATGKAPYKRVSDAIAEKVQLRKRLAELAST